MSLAESEPSSPSRAGAERILEGRFPGREDDARALLPPASLGAVVSRMRDLLRGRSALVVLDIPSSDTPLDGTRLSALKRVVSTLLECGNRQRSSSADRGVHVLVTSQVPIGALGTQVGQAFPERVHLCEPLNRDESVTLLHNLAPFDPYTPPALIAQLVDECVDVKILVLRSSLLLTHTAPLLPFCVCLVIFPPCLLTRSYWSVRPVERQNADYNDLFYMAFRQHPRIVATEGDFIFS